MEESDCLFVSDGLPGQKHSGTETVGNSHDSPFCLRCGVDSRVVSVWSPVGRLPFGNHLRDDRQPSRFDAALVHADPDESRSGPGAVRRAARGCPLCADRSGDGPRHRRRDGRNTVGEADRPFQSSQHGARAEPGPAGGRQRVATIHLQSLQRQSALRGRGGRRTRCRGRHERKTCLCTHGRRHGDGLPSGTDYRPAEGVGEDQEEPHRRGQGRNGAGSAR